MVASLSPAEPTAWIFSTVTPGLVSPIRCTTRSSCSICSGVQPGKSRETLAGARRGALAPPPGAPGPAHASSAGGAQQGP